MTSGERAQQDSHGQASPCRAHMDPLSWAHRKPLKHPRRSFAWSGPLVNYAFDGCSGSECSAEIMGRLLPQPAGRVAGAVGIVIAAERSTALALFVPTRTRPFLARGVCPGRSVFECPARRVTRFLASFAFSMCHACGIGRRFPSEVIRDSSPNVVSSIKRLVGAPDPRTPIRCRQAVRIHYPAVQ